MYMIGLYKTLNSSKVMEQFIPQVNDDMTHDSSHIHHNYTVVNYQTYSAVWRDSIKNRVFGIQPGHNPSLHAIFVVKKLTTTRRNFKTTSANSYLFTLECRKYFWVFQNFGSLINVTKK